MQGKRPSIGLSSALAILAAALFVTSTGAAAQEKVLHSFKNDTDGYYPWASVIQGADGNFYGTTGFGGAYNGGTVFKVTPAGTLTTLYNFCSQPNCADGGGPQSALVQATDGNFYGTTWGGGANSSGTVFKITPAGSLTTLYNFCSQPNCADGGGPTTSLIQGTDGNFYGTTGSTVFKITPTGALTTLHTFCQLNCLDGYNPNASLVQATDGNFYGTTEGGGAYGWGTAFKITPAGTLTTLHSFNGADGAGAKGLVQATDGDFYGTTSALLSYGGGDTVFKMTPSGMLTTLYSFCPAGFPCADGYSPHSALVQAADGNFYGTTSLAGAGAYCYIDYELCGGTVFKITPAGSLTTLYSFCSQPYCADGDGPISGLVQASDGDFYGTTYGGGTYLYGTVFKLCSLCTTVVTGVPNPSMFGEAVTITATVSPAGPPPPTGTVNFTSNGAAISGCTAVPLGSSLTAVCITSTLAVGTDAIVATYSGDANYTPSSGTLAQLVNPIPSPVQFVAVTPCRQVDTRPEHGGSGPIPGGDTFIFPILGGCNIPSYAAAYSLNVTVVPQGPLGYLTIWPTGEGQPVVSTLNSVDGRVKANAAIVPAGTSGFGAAVSIYVTDTTNVILDIDGYFAPVSGSTLAFYPLPPCRVADTRDSTKPPGLGPPQLSSQTPRDFPVLSSTCIPTGVSPAAYSFNFTVVPGGHPVGYLSVWPTGQTQPVVSTLNDQTGTIVANAAIVPAGTGGEVSVYATDNTQLVIDIDGYFAPMGQGGLSLYAVAPCRVIDTRHVGSGQPFSGTLTPPVDVTGSFCGPPATAQAYVFNATVVPTRALGYLTLWPDGQSKPLVSTLNALDGSITNNMAIVPSTNGKVDAYASGITQLILDISSYFAP
jgi:uncharacterized repeat protein (TIGR03803 family)